MASRSIAGWAARHPAVAIGTAAVVLLIVIIGTAADSGTPQNTGSSTGMATGATSSTSTTAPTPDTASGGGATSATGERAAVADGIPDDAQRATVRRIVDGDTLELAAVAAGSVLGSTQQVDVRLLEIDTPETKHPSEPVQCYGGEATSRLRELAAPGSTVWVQRDQELRDQYSRYLLYLWNADGTFVNLSMVQGGYAQAKLYQPNDKHWPTISGAETDAKSANNGLWGACSAFGAPVDTSEPTTQPEPDTGGAGYVVPAPPPDRDCSGIGASNFEVRPGDPHRFDSDGDGIGCEG